MKVLKEIKDLLFPKFCLGCSKEGTYLCQDCQALIDISERHYCLCSPPRLLPYPGKCPKGQNKSLDGLYSACSFKNPLVKKLIHHLNHPPLIRDLASPLADLIIGHFKLSHNDPYQIWKEGVLVPTPLSSVKRKQKGYNPAHQIASHLSLKLSIPLISKGLIKTTPQTRLISLKKDPPERFETGNQDKIKGEKILLVDDLYTKGSAMNKAAKTLKQAQARQVWGITVARR